MQSCALAIRRAAGHRRRHARRDRRIQEVHVEADVQMHVALGHVRERLLHDGPHAQLIDAPHVVDDHAAVDDELLLLCVDRADADLHDAVGRHASARYRPKP